MTTELEMDNVTEGAKPSTTYSPLKQPCTPEQSTSWKKTKVSNLDGGPITLTKGDLCDIGDTIRDATREVLDEAMKEQ